METSVLRRLLQSNLLLAALALAAGLLAAWLGARHLSERSVALEREARQRYATSPYIVASRDLAKGQTIDASLLSIRSMPKAYAPTDALSPAEAGRLIGQRAAVGIRRGTPVMTTLLRESAAARLSEELPEGMRALTIQVDLLNAVSGHLTAGDTVDLYYSRTRGSGAVLVPLLQRVHVLATGDTTEARLDAASAAQAAGEFTAVTLLVSPTDAQRVVLAEQTGRLTVLLRHAADQKLLDARLFDSSELLRPGHADIRGSRRPSDPVELLVGGTGGAPLRSWISPGEGA
ncbi:MAG: Flp pilus assembly protein CpaB [Steroidobacteraceae bacterium]